MTSQGYRNQLMALALGALENDQEYRARQTDDGLIGWPPNWTYADAAFIATAKPSVIVQLLERLEVLTAALKIVEWIAHHKLPFHYCPCCGFDRKLGHDQGCALASALGQADGEEE